ncbi:MAG: Hsp20/alpha crystallin family protein [Armatimonadota bacterium]
MASKNLTKKERTKKELPKVKNFKWGFDPMLPLITLKLSVDELFSEIFTNKASLKKDALLHPKSATYSHNNKYYIEIELPGIEKDDIRFHITDNYLILTAESGRKVNIDEKKFHLNERKLGMYLKNIPLRMPIESKNFKAELKNGVLEISAEIKK